MSTHHHLSSEEICEQISLGLDPQGIAGCERCEAEARSLAGLLADLRRADASLARTTDWDDLLLRSRIREAVARERPHSRSIWDRFALLRPAFVSALVAVLVFAVWSPLSPRSDSDRLQLVAGAGSRAAGHLPAWTPLPDESEDEGLAVLAEWTPNEDELAIARCRAACLGGLTTHEEENLLQAFSARSPLTGANPL
ncbi:MAG: hypothetical protein JJE39_03640 [Vicinamibacteria bacterium]|nr:hypothetical protein [Vicinamibacteria bacterium]